MEQRVELSQVITSSSCQRSCIICPIIGRLIHFLSAWQRIGAENLVRRDIKAYQIHQECPSIQQRNRYIPIENSSEASMIALDQLINQELEEKIIIQVQEKDLSQTNPCFAIPKPGTNKLTKITNCSILNNFSPVFSLHYGGYQYPQGTYVKGRLDVQDRSGVSFPPQSCGSSIPTFSGFYAQGQVLQIHNNVLWSQSCPFDIPQSSPSYDQNQLRTPGNQSDSVL
ncbi:MAG: hypothetical protein EZS28_043698 [Streblomastix strix]|uniref:Uncharacterized protein n=1 Tax=Streblomastix strix TaxID=222440 RepID=A0A5J4TQL3_9EUKA|nr:MAG: hypothetical protein EZS28_043698 [Streblomastix strix]